MLLRCVDGFASFQITFQPSQNALPSFGMTGCLLRSAGESFMTDFYQRARAGLARTVGMQPVNAGGLELPPDDSFERAAITRDPGMDEEARRVDFQIFAVDAKRCSVGTDAHARPFAARTQIALPLCNAIHALLAPPLRQLVGIGDGLEDACRRRGDKDFCEYSVLIGTDCCGCHKILQCVRRLVKLIEIISQRKFSVAR